MKSKRVGSKKVKTKDINIAIDKMLNMRAPNKEREDFMKLFKRKYKKYYSLKELSLKYEEWRDEYIKDPKKI